MSNNIYVLNGPNLNLLGTREPELYGHETLESIQKDMEHKASVKGYDLVFRQSNSEGQLVDWVQQARDNSCGLIINPGAYTHTSIALLDAILAVNIPCIELHLSNIFRREEFRHHSYISKGVIGVICGFGANGYGLALNAITDVIEAKKKS